MPKAFNSDSTPARTRNSARTLPFIAAEFNGEKVTVRRNPDYQETVQSIKRACGALVAASSCEIALHSRFNDYDDDIRITADLWAEVLPIITLVKVVFDEGASFVTQECNCNGVVIVRTLTRKMIRIEPTCRHTTISQFKVKILKMSGVPPVQQRLIHARKQLEDKDTLETHKIEKETIIDLVHRLRGGKPVIYLLSPTPRLGVQVQLSLTNTWQFSALYPTVAIDSGGPSSDFGQSVTWTVDLKPDGTLFDQVTRREVAYLFWEAHTNPVVIRSPACSRPATPVNGGVSIKFDPSRPEINSTNSALLPFDEVTGYIDDVLLGLGLHTEARTSFITYWLPNLQEHMYIALRFLPQDQYKTAAPLKVTPAPDVTTRVFMLFRGVNEEDVELWDKASVAAARLMSRLKGRAEPRLGGFEPSLSEP